MSAKLIVQEQLLEVVARGGHGACLDHDTRGNRTHVHQHLGGGHHLDFFFFNDPATPELYPLPLHAALPIFTAVTPASSNPSSKVTETRASLRFTRVRCTCCMLISSPSFRTTLKAVWFAGIPVNVRNFGSKIGRAHV